MEILINLTVAPYNRSVAKFKLIDSPAPHRTEANTLAATNQYS